MIDHIRRTKQTISFLLLAPPIQQVALEEILDHPILLDLIDNQDSLQV